MAAFDDLASQSGASRTAAIAAWLDESASSVELVARAMARVKADPVKVAEAVSLLSEAIDTARGRFIAEAAELARPGLHAQQAGQAGQDGGPPASNTGG